MKHLYIFAEWGAYGQFVIACIASSLEEAQELCEIKKNNWNPIPEITMLLSQDQESKVIFSGGGDNG